MTVQGAPLDPAFWRGRRVLLTGHTGFKGAWTCLLLRRLGADVTGYALAPPTDPSLFDVAAVGAGMTSVIGDVCDGALLTETVRRAAPDVVVHMAAQSLVRASYRDPVETYRVNALGTAHVLDAIRVTGTRAAVLVVTSDKCYENAETGRAFVESDRLGGHDPYSSSKACTELVASSYRNSFFPIDRHDEHGVCVATARAGNVIGGGDWAQDRLLPDIVTALAAGRPVSVRNPHAYRPWQHVFDALHGYLVLLQSMTRAPQAHAEAWNFGPSDAHVRTVGELVTDVCSRWSETAAWEHDGTPQPHEAQRLVLDASKARTRLGLGPGTDYRTTVERTVSWYRAFHTMSEMETITRDHVGMFIDEALAGGRCDPCDAVPR